MTQNPKLQVGLTGHFALNIYNPETGEHRQYEFDNIITNGGLNRLGNAGTGFVIRYVQVGTGSNAPAVTDSALTNFLAGTDRSYSYTASFGSSPTYYTEGTHSWQFNQGAAVGNLSEIGVGWASSGSLFSRALILDGNGNPTTITVTAIEFLTVTYKLRMYPPTTDVTGTIALDGSNYDYILRASEVGGSGWRDQGLYAYGANQTAYQMGRAFNGDIGSITGSPTGTMLNFHATAATYSEGSYKRVITGSMGINECNFSGGLRSIYFIVNGYGTYNDGPQMRWQCQFNPKIPKDNTKTLSLTFEVSWARKI